MNPATEKKELRSNIIILLFVLAVVIIFVSYLATHFTGETGIRSDEGVVFCQPENAPPPEQKCYYTAHGHVHFDIKVCGEAKVLPYETGDLEKLHTHVETNKMHWHGLLPVDPVSKKITDYPNLRLQDAFAELKVPISENGIYNLKNGDSCPNGKIGNLRVRVNGVEKQDFLNYVVKDKDHIEIEF